MAGGYWGKNQNPYWNYDSDAARQDQRANNAELNAFRAGLAAETAEGDASRLRNQLNNTITNHKKVVSGYEQKIERMQTSFFRLAIKSNIFYKTLLKLQEKWPDKKEDILDEIQVARNEANTEEYRQKWWTWVKEFDMSPENDYLKFPFESREIKKPKM